MKKNKAEKFSKNVISLSKNEDELKSVAQQVGALIDLELDAMGLLHAQEKIRDMIRSESFAEKFWVALGSHPMKEIVPLIVSE